MIDLVKLELKNDSLASSLLKNPNLDFETTVENSTGEVKRQKAVFRGLTFLVYPNGKIVIEGSLHKYRNEGKHNFDDFTFVELSRTITELCQTFGFFPQNATLHGIEFGVNVRIGQNPANVLRMIICYRNDATQKMNISARAEGLQSVQTNYVVKIYDKSLQYRPEELEDILRVEQKILRMVQIKRLGINTLHDLTNATKVASLGNLLFAMFDDLIIYEPVNVAALSKADLKLYEQAANPNFWRDLGKRERYKKRKQFEQIIQLHGSDKIKETIANLVRTKWFALLKNSDFFTDFLESKKQPNSDYFTGSIGLKSPFLNNEFILTEKPLKNRLCLSCGRDISSQRKGSKFCSEKLFGRGVKACRNKVSNPTNNPQNNPRQYLKRRVLKAKENTLLFDFKEVFRLTQEQRKMLIEVNFNQIDF